MIAALLGEIVASMFISIIPIYRGNILLTLYTFSYVQPSNPKSDVLSYAVPFPSNSTLNPKP